MFVENRHERFREWLIKTYNKRQNYKCNFNLISMLFSILTIRKSKILVPPKVINYDLISLEEKV